MSRAVPPACRAVLCLAVLSLSPAPRWERALAPGRGCWPPRCAPGQLPLATPPVEHGGRLLMLGDGAASDRVYESGDGVRWTERRHEGGWGPRYGVAIASFRGALWRAGGFVEERAGGRDGARRAFNDVWRSPDGVRWTRVLAAAPWPPRARAQLVAFRDTLWLIGGEPADSLVWHSADGVTWHPVAGVPAQAIDAQRALVHRGRLWLVGGGTWGAPAADVWSSPDGRAWTRATAAAPWPGRMGAGVAAFRGRLWLFGGADHGDVWSSADGRDWAREPDLPGIPRAANYSVVFRDALWVFGGKTGGRGGTGFSDEVWALR